MSKYTNYDKVSQTYDSVRYASGVETMTNILAGILKKNPEEICMLEAGCGTGNYSRGFLQNGIGKLTMFDANEGMLGRAKEKVAGYNNKVTEIRQHALPSIPYPDESFDAIAFVQVLHHLDTYHLKDDKKIITNGELDNTGSNLEEDDENELNEMFSARAYIKRYPNLIQAMREAFRVLKPNGVLLIDHSFEQNINASWISMAPKAHALFKKAFISGNDLIEILRTQHFENIFCVTRPGSAVSRVGLHNNPELVLDDKWRSNLSEWSFVDRSGELSSITDKVRQMKDEGKLSQFAYEQNRGIRLCGESTTVFAQKL